MRKFGKKFWIFITFSIYLFFSCSIYLNLRNDIFVNWRTPIDDERILTIIEQAEEIVKPGVEIRYYSLKTFSYFTPSWQSSINAYYHVSGIWPFNNFDKVFITDVTLERLSDRELLFIIGHELGHARADRQWRGKGFLLANISLCHSLAAFFRSDSTNEQYFIRRKIVLESEADEAGIECVGPEEALRILRFLRMIPTLNGSLTDITDGRIKLIKDKYNLN